MSLETSSPHDSSDRPVSRLEWLTSGALRRERSRRRERLNRALVVSISIFVALVAMFMIVLGGIRLTGVTAVSGSSTKYDLDMSDVSNMIIYLSVDGNISVSIDPRMAPGPLRLLATRRRGIGAPQWVAGSSKPSELSPDTEVISLTTQSGKGLQRWLQAATDDILLRIPGQGLGQPLSLVLEAGGRIDVNGAPRGSTIERGIPDPARATSFALFAAMSDADVTIAGVKAELLNVYARGTVKGDACGALTEFSVFGEGGVELRAVCALPEPRAPDAPLTFFDIQSDEGSLLLEFADACPLFGVADAFVSEVDRDFAVAAPKDSWSLGGADSEHARVYFGASAALEPGCAVVELAGYEGRVTLASPTAHPWPTEQYLHAR